MFGSKFTSIAILALLDPSLSVVDIGCGIGNAATIIAPYVKNVVGIDREPTMLHRAINRPDVADNITFKEGPAGALPLEDETYDVAMFVWCSTTSTQSPMRSKKSVVL